MLVFNDVTCINVWLFMLINNTALCITRNYYISAKLGTIEEFLMLRFEKCIDVQMFK